MFAGLILAAGQGSRFGSDKRRALLPADGHAEQSAGPSLLDASLAPYKDTHLPLWVVIPPNDAFALQACQRHGAKAVIQHHAEQGMGRSLAVGLAQIMSDVPSGLNGIIVGLADMPMVSTQAIGQVLEALTESCQHGGAAKPVVPCHRGRMGHPRGIPSAYFEALLDLQGDEGAKALLDWREATQVQVDCPGILLDIDTPQDLAKLMPSRPL